MKTDLYEGRELQHCPACGALPDVCELTKSILIICSHKGCRQIHAADKDNAIRMWNEPMNHKTNFPCRKNLPTTK